MIHFLLAVFRHPEVRDVIDQSEEILDDLDSMLEEHLSFDEARRKIMVHIPFFFVKSVIMPSTISLCNPPPDSRWHSSLYYPTSLSSVCAGCNQCGKTQFMISDHRGPLCRPYRTYSYYLIS